jgi:haloalkane dehalogenase
MAGFTRCLAPDLLGFGRSSGMPGRTYRFLDHARYLEAWLAAVVPDGRVTFVA